MAIELQDKLYTSAQVADVLGVSLRTLYRYMEDGRIESMKTASGRHRFTKEQILTFLDGGGFDQDLEVGSMPRTSNQRDQGRDSGRDTYDPAPVRNQANNDFSFYSNKDREDRNAARPAAPVAPASRTNYDMDFNNPYERNRDRVEPMRQQPQEQQPMARKDPYDDLDMDPEDDFDDFNFSLDENDFEEKPKPSQAQPRSRFDATRSDSYGSQSPAPQSRANMSSRALDRGEDDMYSRPASNAPRAPYSPAPKPAMPAYPSDNRRSDFGTRDVQRDSQIQAKPKQPALEGINVRYYKSDYNDLIDLAKRIKETAISKDLEYAFTLNAGLSLHYLIDPFTVLHFYVNPEDLQLWKSSLGLVPVSNKAEANIGVLVNTDIVFIPTKEIGGFKVVEDKLLLKDLMRASEDNLVREFRQRILNI
jgi:excisionase family DNA binding protein